MRKQNQFKGKYVKIYICKIGHTLCFTARCAGKVICTTGLHTRLPPVENKPLTVQVCTINRSSIEVFLTLWSFKGKQPEVIYALRGEHTLKQNC